MNKIMMILMLAIAASSVAFGQTNMSKDANLEARLIASEKAVWNALLTGRFDDFANMLAEDFLGVSAETVKNKTEDVAETGHLKFKKADLSNFKVQMPNKDNAVVIYELNVEAVTPDGGNLAGTYRSTSVWVKRGGKWLILNHSDMPISAAAGAMQKEKRETFSLRPAVEKEYGYIHAMRIGDDLKISGAVSMDDKGMLVAPGNLEQQMKNCYADLEKILAHYGYTFDDVTVENVFTTDMAGFIKVSGYRNSIYKNGFPTGTWLEVKGLALPGQLIEIDMEAHKSR